MRTLKFSLVVIVAVCLLGSVGAMAQESEELHFGVFIVSAENPFFPKIADGAKAYGEEHNIEVTMFDGTREPGNQLRQVEDAITRRIDGIILNPIDTKALVPAVEEANRADVPVATTDRDVTGGERLAYFGTNNVKAAELEAKEALEAVRAAHKWGPSHQEKPFRIAILEGVPGSSAGNERKEGVHNYLDPLVEEGEVEIVADLPGDFSKPGGLSAMEDVLSRTQDIDAVICTNDNMAMGAITALQEAGMEVGFPDGVIVTGLDGQPFAFDALKEGTLTTSIAQSPWHMGYWAAQALANNIRNGWTPPEDQPVYEPTGATFYNTGAYVINWSNVDQRVPYKVFEEPQPLPGLEE